MLDSLFVHNFRLFKKLEIEQLSRVNLIVGKNNSGKSCFLEAVRIYLSDASPRILLELISQRNELWEFELQGDGQSFHEYENPFRYLFYGYHLPNVGGEEIQIGLSNNTQSRLHVKTQFYKKIISSQGEYFDQELSQNEIDINLVNKIAFEMRKGELSRLVPLDDLLNDLSKQSPTGIGISRFLSYPISIRRNIQFIPAGGMEESRASFLWDNINLTDLHDEVIEGLRLINQNIKGVVLVGGEQVGSKSRIPIVRLEQSPERFPLKSMGDGMIRLFHLILALANAKDGTLLVDEFENGLHWSVLPKVWDAVFKLAERLNVQVFATTHSRDCILGFKQAWEQNESLGSFHRLDADSENGAKSTAYSLETLSDALDMDVEVR
ncbi:MAG: AAA family ATPase [Candidatus Competibacteraceae bacterium]|uniref:ATPase AAA-type core domain-containing protein n=1 Tax=Candidatus Contendobacter odensis Run_B_J11 TaxID=1400861 RepID=A0A7U7J3L5_9GAMM|nr:AAA family ATPase [Candidatus Contendobacter odensis]MBK8533933.1 AAA family ATPase [Candidatus Competibacteraceae bacterium]MBK8751211.1 AAA family ATPase [Candidatus Competibacteraceae bacterium]CDH44295.1 conserved hypothetical protein [Candidatus Contendobacter odensis Run_B_J11]